jgi:hypothetical protein
MDELDIDAADLSSCRFGKILPSRLTGQSVALIVKRWALEAGFDPALFAGHSLRSGLATAADKAGKSERSIMKQTGHRSVTVVRRYIRDDLLFVDILPCFTSRRQASFAGGETRTSQFEMSTSTRPSTMTIASTSTSRGRR